MWPPAARVTSDCGETDHTLGSVLTRTKGFSLVIGSLWMDLKPGGNRVSDSSDQVKCAESSPLSIAQLWKKVPLQYFCLVSVFGAFSILVKHLPLLKLPHTNPIHYQDMV